jgi:20S proteasome subunit alpha 7
MTAVGTGYDLGSNTYSPAGRVFQVEYAEKAVEHSGTVIGVRCKDGVVMAVEKLIRSKMLVPKSYRRIFTVAKSAGMAIGGVLPDGRQLVNRGRQEALNYKRNFGIEIPGKVLSNRIAMFVHAYTEYWHLRPFGVSVLLATYDENIGPALFMIDPSGENHQYNGVAVGKGQQQARVELEKLDFEKLTCAEAAVKLGEIIYSVHDELKDKPLELEMSWVCDASDRKHVLVPDEILEAAKAAGSKVKEDEESDDEDEEMAT